MARSAGDHRVHALGFYLRARPFCANMWHASAVDYTFNAEKKLGRTPVRSELIELSSRATKRAGVR